MILNRIIAEDLLESEEFIDKNNRLKAYYERIKEILPCLYFKGCTNRKNDENFYNKLVSIKTFENKYKPEWKRIKSIKENKKNNNSKIDFENSLSKETEDNIDKSILFFKGIAEYNNSNYLKSIGILSQCIKNHYKLAESYLYRGMCYYRIADEMSKSKQEPKDILRFATYSKYDFDSSINNDATYWESIDKQSNFELDSSLSK